MQEYLLKQQFEGFSVSALEDLHKGYDRFQTLLSQLEIHGAGVLHEDANKKFRRSLPSFWSQMALIMKTKPWLDTLSFDDQYNNLRVSERDVKGTTVSSSSNTQNVAFVFADNTSSTNDVSTAYSVFSPSVLKSQKEGSSSYNDEVIHSFFANQLSALQLDYEDLEQINDDDMEEIDLKWHFTRDCRAKGNQDSRRRDVGFNGNKARDNGRIPSYHDDSKALVTIDGEDIDWSRHVEEDVHNYAMMAYSFSNSGSDNKESDLENTSVNDRYGDGMHAVPPPMTGNYMPSGPDVEIDYSKFIYGPKETSVDESDSKPSKYVSCESDSSTDAPIIEEYYESDSDDDLVSNVQENKEKPSFAFTESVKHVKPCRENVKETSTPNHSPKAKKHDRNGHTRKGLGYAFTRKACVIYGSFSHLIRDCDFHENRMAKQAELTKSKNKDDPHKALKDKGIIDSGCSNGRITGKGKIKAGRLDFEDVYYVEELKHYNLFSVSQMCDNKNKVLFTDTDCLVLSLDFKLPYENQVLLKIPRQHNMYSFNLKNIDLSRDLAFLFAKASIDESNKWHRRLGHVNFKNLNKLVKGNLVRGLPSKIFENDHTCVACQKGKQHKASCKAKTVSSVNQPLQILHMDLFGPTYVRSINHKTYCLVITDGFSRSDNETEFKNNELIELCGLKGIKREYSNARTPQQNGVAERKNRTLIEAARTIKAFRVYNLETKRVKENLHVNFLENKPNVAGKGHAWMFDLDYLTNSMNYEPISIENQANKSAGLKEANNSAGTQANDDQGATSEEIDLHEEHFVLPIWSAYSTTVKSSRDKLKKNSDFKTSRKETTHENQDALTNSTNLLNAISTPISTAGPSRAFNNGEPSYLDDPSMPHLEDIYASPSEGIFNDSSYDDEARIKAIRIFLAFASYMGFIVYQMDEKSAFLYGTIDEEVYVTQPPGFVDLKFPNKVYKVVKALYGLHQAPRAWYATLSTFLKKKDIIFGLTKKSWCDEFEGLMKNRFQMSSMGELTFFLGLQVKQKEDGIFISHDKYFAETLKKIDFLSVKTTSTLIETQKPLVKDEEADDVNVTPKTSHIQAMKRIFRHLKGQPKLGNPQHEVVNFLAGDLFHGIAKSRLLWLLLLQRQNMLLLHTAMDNPQVVSAAKLPILNPNEFDLWKMRIEQYFLMTDYSLWEVILNGDSPAPTRVVDGILQPVAPTTAEQRLARKNELKARGTLLIALPDKHQLKFNTHKDAKTLMEPIEKSLKIYEAEVKSSSSASTSTQNIAFVSSSNTNSTNEPISATASVSIVSAKILVSSLLNVDSLTNAVIYSFFASQSSSPQLDNDDLKQIDADDLQEMDLKWNGAADPQRRNVPVETSTSNDLVSQFDGVGSYDWSFQAKEEPTNYALMAFSSSRSSSENEVVSCSKACTKAYATFQSHYDKLTEDYRKSQFDVISYQTGLESIEAILLVYQQNEFVFEDDIKLLKLKVQLRDNDLVSLRQNLEKAKQERDDLKLKLEKFQTSSKNLSELLASQINDKTGLGNNSQVFTRAMFDCDDYLSSRSDESFPPSPIYDRYQSGNGYHVVPPPYTGTFMAHKPDLVLNNAPNDVMTDHPVFTIKLSPTKPDQDLSHTNRSSAPIIEDWVSDSEDESTTKTPQNVPSFVQSTEQVKFSGPSVQHVETSIPAATPKPTSPKPTSNGKHKKRKACFVCKTTVPKFKLVTINAARPITAVVPKIKVTRSRQYKPIVTKSNSPTRRHINCSPSLKASNSPPRVTAVKVPVDNPQHALNDKGVIVSGCSRHMTRNMSCLSNFEKLNGGYVAFGVNPKGGKISRKGKIKTGKLDFEEVYFVKELKLNLFSVSHICDKKNTILFTDTECIVLSPEFKLPDENQVMLRVPRENNMYNVNLKNIVPSGDLTCLFAKVTLDESKAGPY
uniref:Putative ribonuclease H-like domain-containing protein n=1 Tax=Tanacetum cinerariifolium TaxID=118510 RepID=A0A6L2KJ87_TANCI|nr:putative ribonuclease H-like domain-containing protein [Tanacetum cinerariifolium]